MTKICDGYFDSNFMCIDIKYYNNFYNCYDLKAELIVLFLCAYYSTWQKRRFHYHDSVLCGQLGG